MRHACEIGDDRFAANGFAEADCQLERAIHEIGFGDQFPQIDGIAAVVREFDADGIAAGNDSNARGNGAHGAGNIIGQANDAR